MVAAIVPLEWLNLMVAEPKRDDERAGGLTLRYEGVLTVALELASMVTEWMAPMTPLMTSMAPIASLASMVASMDLMMVLLASMASMVASLVWLRLMTEPRTDGKRDDGLIQKICEERADELTHKIGEEGADELTLKSDGERVERLTHKIREERADGLTHKICEERVDGLTLKIDGERVERLTHKISEERADGLTHKRGSWTMTAAKVVGELIDVDDDQHKYHFMSPKNTEEIRILERAGLCTMRKDLATNGSSHSLH